MNDCIYSRLIGRSLRMGFCAAALIMNGIQKTKTALIKTNEPVSTYQGHGELEVLLLSITQRTKPDQTIWEVANGLLAIGKSIKGTQTEYMVIRVSW